MEEIMKENEKTEKANNVESTDNANIAEKTGKLSSKHWTIIGIVAALVVIAGTLIFFLGDSSAEKLQEQLDLGQKYLEEMNYEEAVVAFEAAIEIDPMSVESYIGLAKAYIGMGNIGLAVQTLERCYEMTGVNIMQEIDYVIEWKDEIIERLLREYIGKPEGDVYWSDVWEIKELYIFGDYLVTNGGWSWTNGIYTMESYSGNEITVTTRGKISSFEDLRHLASLESLDFRYQNSFDFDNFANSVSNLSNLTDLDLSSNNISDISAISNLSNLTDLWVSGNNISDISALSNLSNLMGLRLEYNNISDISALSNLSNLTHLDLSDNNISDISALSNLSNLTYLYLSGNNISDISAISNLSNLTDLDLDGSKNHRFYH